MTEQILKLFEEALVNIKKENADLKEWTLRALRIDHVKHQKNRDNLRKIQRSLDWIYQRVKDIDMGKLDYCKTKLKDIKGLLKEINFY